MSYNKPIILVILLLPMVWMLSNRTDATINDNENTWDKVVTKELIVVDDAGKQRIILNTMPGGDPIIQIRDRWRNDRITLLSNNDGVQLRIGGDKAKAQMLVSVSDKGEASILILKQSDEPDHYKSHLSIQLSEANTLGILAVGPSGEVYSIELDDQGSRTLLGDIVKSQSCIQTVVNSKNDTAMIDIIGNNGVVLQRLPKAP